MIPKRIQLRRTKGWRKPENTIVVARPTRWGNPYRWNTIDAINSVALHGEITDAALRQWAVDQFDENLNEALLGCETAHPVAVNIARDLDRLRGYDLACWCPLDQPCHADILLWHANHGEGY